MARKYLPEKVRRYRDEVAEVVEELEAADLTIAGSWRRGAATVGDLDILVPAEQDYAEVIAWAHVELGYTEMRGGMTSQGTVPLGDGNLLLNFWQVRAASEWGGMLLFASGPVDLNISMRARAMERGLTLSQYGLFDGDTQLDDGTEEGIFELLDLEFIAAEDRGGWRALYRTIYRTVMSTVLVPSSDGASTYEVTVRDGIGWECECRGFMYRRKCRHLAEAVAR